MKGGNITLQEEKSILMYDRIFKTIIGNHKDPKILEYVLKDILEEEVHIKEFVNTNLKVRNKKERVKVTDLIVTSSKGKEILVEVNSNYSKSIKIRNLSYYCSYYSQIVERGREYEEEMETVLINLNYQMNKSLPMKETYYIIGKERGKRYTNSFKIIDVNLAKYKELCYDECIKGNKEHIHIVMLNSNIEEIKKLSKKDEVVKEYEEKMLTLTKDGVVINHLSYEEDQEKIMRSLKKEYRKEGLEEGIKEGKEKGFKIGLKEGAIDSANIKM